ncbi:MAG TPA: PstS family phosphate ABC transporter substrate-binding protein [Thermomicrobiales bacterium]|nr:PstS family phosphate ABC transporter substrate-binding protein [Thermomicrobiales bacterium]
MKFGNVFRRAVAVAVAGMFTLAQLVSAQQATEYAVPENIDDISGAVATDGSSTVGPMTAAVAEEFRDVAENIDVTVDVSGTGGGFKRFCQGDIDISNASREIKPEEVELCAENDVEFYEFEIALDALTVVVSSENHFVDCLTVEQLNQLWAPDSRITHWNQLDESFPDEPIYLYGPGADSGTFDYFTEVINGEGGASRTDFQPSEDDNVIVQGVHYDPYALGYLGLAYYLENATVLHAVAVDSGDGCVVPSAEAASSGDYAPLARPLYTYVRADSLERQAVQEFLRFYLANAEELADDVGYVPMSDEQIAEQWQKLEGAIEGSAAPDSEEELQ